MSGITPVVSAPMSTQAAPPYLPGFAQISADSPLQLLFEFFDMKSLGSAAQVCKEWRIISSTDYLWEKFVNQVFSEYRDRIRPLETQGNRSYCECLQRLKNQNLQGQRPFVHVFSVPHARLARQEEEIGEYRMGEIVFTIAKSVVYRSFFHTANTTNEKIQELLANINVLSFQERNVLAHAINNAALSHPHIEDLPKFVMEIGLVSTNPSVRARFLPYKQAEEEEGREIALFLQQMEEKRRGMEQINAACVESYGFRLDNWDNNRDGFGMGHFGVTIPAHSSISQIAAVFNQKVSEHRVKYFDNAPGYRFQATMVHVTDGDVIINAPEAKVYGFFLAGNKIPVPGDSNTTARMPLQCCIIL